MQANILQFWYFQVFLICRLLKGEGEGMTKWEEKALQSLRGEGLGTASAGVR